MVGGGTVGVNIGIADMHCSCNPGKVTERLCVIIFIEGTNRQQRAAIASNVALSIKAGYTPLIIHLDGKTVVIRFRASTVISQEAMAHTLQAARVGQIVHVDVSTLHGRSVRTSLLHTITQAFTS